jgi:hypothetical protein
VVLLTRRTLASVAYCAEGASTLATAEIVATDAVDAAGIGGTRTAALALGKLSDELGDVVPVLCFDPLVHRARLLAMQCAVLADVAFGHGNAIRVDAAASIVVRRADRGDICAAVADVFAATDQGQQCEETGHAEKLVHGWVLTR